MAESYIMLDVNDARAGAVAEVLGNKTCKKILQLLSEKELSETEIANKLNSPANTINYNVKKLVDAGLIEKADKFWSVKGKSVSTYKISNKKILISPRPLIKGILPAAIVTGLLAFGVKTFFAPSNVSYSSSGVSNIATPAVETGAAMIKAAPNMIIQPTADRVAETAVSGQAAIIASSGIGPWAWFLFGAWLALLIFVGWQVWRR